MAQSRSPPRQSRSYVRSPPKLAIHAAPRERSVRGRRGWALPLRLRAQRLDRIGCAARAGSTPTPPLDRRRAPIRRREGASTEPGRPRSNAPSRARRSRRHAPTRTPAPSARRSPHPASARSDPRTDPSSAVRSAHRIHISSRSVAPRRANAGVADAIGTMRLHCRRRRTPAASAVSPPRRLAARAPRVSRLATLRSRDRESCFDSPRSVRLRAALRSRPHVGAVVEIEASIWPFVSITPMTQSACRPMRRTGRGLSSPKSARASSPSTLTVRRDADRPTASSAGASYGLPPPAVGRDAV